MKYNILRLLSLFLIPFLLLISAPQAHASEITSFRWSSRNDCTPPFVRMVMDLSKPVKAEASMSDDGQLLTLVLHDTSIGDIYKEYKMDPRGVHMATLSMSGKDAVLQVALSKKQSIRNINIFPLKPDAAAKKSHRLIVDVPIPGVKAPKKESIAPAPSKEYLVTNRAKKVLKGKVICIDPGHGGTDTGAIAHLNGKDVYEKDINMSIAVPLRDLLTSAGATVLMTRKGDTDVYGPWSDGVKELQARCDVANKGNADAFLSIHIDAFSNPNIDGVTTYYALKSDADALLANKIHGSILRTLSIPDRGVRANDFYVNIHTDMPSILVEVGYMSNVHRLKMLTSAWAPRAIAQTIFDGFVDYFEELD